MTDTWVHRFLDETTGVILLTGEGECDEGCQRCFYKIRESLEAKEPALLEEGMRGDGGEEEAIIYRAGRGQKRSACDK